jgi:hypothetical protein
MGMVDIEVDYGSSLEQKRSVRYIEPWLGAFLSVLNVPQFLSVLLSAP